MFMFTPMMQQYMKVKDEYEDCVLFYRLGDFYEMFFGDAKVASDVLGLTLTGKDCGMEERAPMCGVPFHSCDGYIAKLVENGYKVAICEQITDPKESKGLVERKVIKVVTPGTITIPDAVDDKKNNYLISIVKDGAQFGIAATDVSTGELHASLFNNDTAKSDLLSELSKYNPSEIIINESFSNDTFCMRFISEKFKVFSQVIKENLSTDNAFDIISGHFEKKYSKSEILGYSSASVAVAMLMNYLAKIQMTDLKHISEIDFYTTTQYLGLDTVARTNLELIKTMRDGNRRGSLLSVLDKTQTSMGARLMANWIQQPLVSCGHIQRRHNAVEELFKDNQLRYSIREALKGINDMERLVSKFEYLTVNAKDLLALKESIVRLPELMKSLSQTSSSLLMELFTDFDLLTDIYNLIDIAINDDPPFTLREGGLIKEGYDTQLDEWINGRKNGKDSLAKLEAEEKEKTGIKNLKIGFNKVFGYYIEVTRSYLDLVPDRFIRKQTLANAERYITEELKEIEDIVLRSDEKIVNREYNLFCELRDQMKSRTERMKKTAKIISTVDVISTLAEVAVKNNYVKPEIVLGNDLDIKDGRHPVVECFTKDCMFVPNDTYMNGDEDSFLIITGPNMAGKSTYMRQVAIIVIMAQMGGFVPASYAKIGIVDKIFTRIGASDDLASGQSTFMVEMNEVANIADNATKNSLLILDEIGRGTSTFDGMAIAWAIVEHISNKKKVGARTLFATHYHELTELEGKLSGVKNYCIVAKKREDDIVFLRKIVKGAADESYGIEVAKLAGVNNEIIKCAKRILKDLEAKQPVKEKQTAKQIQTDNMQFDMYDDLKSELIDEIKKIDLNVLSPIETMNILFELKKKADKIL